MAKQDRPEGNRTTRGRSRTVNVGASAAKTAEAAALDPEAEAPPAERSPAEPKPAVALVPDAPAETTKRRQRAAPPAVTKKIRKPKPKPAAKPDILFLVETQEESEQYELVTLTTIAELLDLMDENRKIVATRSWREF